VFLHGYSPSLVVCTSTLNPRYPRDLRLTNDFA
jgi:hypothetical protein